MRDVTKKVSGVLAGPRDEPAGQAHDPALTAAPSEEAPITTGPVPQAAAAPPQAPEPSTVEAGTEPETVERRTGEEQGTDPQTVERRTGEEQAIAPDRADGRAVEDSDLRERAVDERCAAAVELARAAAAEVADTVVGDHLGVEGELEPGSGHLVTHWFASTDPAYTGWRWAVSVARAEGSDEVTVDEVVLLPGAEALLAPAWVPWSERVRPGDLGAGDLLPPPADDPRLVPAYADVDADELPFDLHRELGLGRPRVLSLEGRAEAVERWYEGSAGPDTPIAKAAPGRCGGCGFLVPLAGALGRVFGACANAMSPDDGRVVALTHGCGAHSETVVEQPESTYAGMAVELEELELVDADTQGAPAT